MNILSSPVQFMYYGVIGILGIGLLIGIHELGHFLFAKLFKVRTPSFSIGFGPKIFSKQIGDTLFSLSAIPLGGYVEVSGMAEMGQGEQSESASLAHDSFAVKPFWQKLLILFGGILFNILFAYAAFSIVFMLGAPKSDLLYPLGITTDKPIIRIIREGAAADKGGLKPGDEIITINGANINNSTDRLKEILQQHPGEMVSISLKRDGIEQTREILLDTTNTIIDGEEKEIGTLGVFFEIDKVPSYDLFESIIQGIRATNIFIATIAYSFKNMFSKKGISSIGGPIAVISETMKGAQKGFKVLLIFLALISINLAILNLIPLPILDGGQILFVTIETIIGKQLPKLREYIHIASWLFILALFIYLTAKDTGLLKLFNLS